MANLPTKEDIFNLLTLSYNVHDNRFDSDFFIRSYRELFPIELGDYVQCNKEIVSVGLVDVPTNLVVEYYNKKNKVKRKYCFTIESIKRCDISYVDDNWFDLGGSRLNDDETIYLNSIPGMAEKIKRGMETPLSECFEIDVTKEMLGIEE